MPTDAQPEPSATPLPRRRWFQYSISTLLLLMAVCAVVLALVVNPARRQRRAVEYVEGLGGGVHYTKQGDTGWRYSPEWLKQRLGRDCFASVDHVNLNGTQISDAGLAHLKGLTALREIMLLNTQVSGPGLAHLKGLTSLEGLYLRNTRINDAGLEYLKALTALEWLHLGNTHISDAGLAHLQGLTALEELDLENTQISDAGLAQLQGLTALKRLFLNNTQVSDAGVAKLRNALPNCHIKH